jgi:PIN domain nuclease of toxin-antitoxin system
MSKQKFVLDASAILTLFFREPGSDVVENYLENGEAMISAVNVSEVWAKQQELQMPYEQTMGYLLLMGIQVVDFNVDMAVSAASLRSATKSFGLSFGDRACLALGKKQECLVLTADRSWAELDVGTEVVVIR